MALNLRLWSLCALFLLLGSASTAHASTRALLQEEGNDITITLQSEAVNAAQCVLRNPPTITPVENATIRFNCVTAGATWPTPRPEQLATAEDDCGRPLNVTIVRATVPFRRSPNRCEGTATYRVRARDAARRRSTADISVTARSSTAPRVTVTPPGDLRCSFTGRGCPRSVNLLTSNDVTCVTGLNNTVVEIEDWVQVSTSGPRSPTRFSASATCTQTVAGPIRLVDNRGNAVTEAQLQAVQGFNVSAINFQNIDRRTRVARASITARTNCASASGSANLFVCPCRRDPAEQCQEALRARDNVYWANNNPRCSTGTSCQGLRAQNCPTPFSSAGDLAVLCGRRGSNSLTACANETNPNGRPNFLAVLSATFLNINCLNAGLGSVQLDRDVAASVADGSCAYLDSPACGTSARLSMRDVYNCSLDRVSPGREGRRREVLECLNEFIQFGEGDAPCPEDLLVDDGRDGGC